MMIGANTVEHDLRSDVGRKSTDDDFAGKEDTRVHSENVNTEMTM